MNQQNPIFDNNVNVSKTHPLIDFLWLGGAAIMLVVGLTITLYLSMSWLAPYVPFSFEQTLVSKINLAEEMSTDIEPDPEHQKRLDYLQKLADELSVAQGLPEDFKITIHWMDDDIVNAFATLGGHIFITKGLWDEMPNENALAMVIAHEIGHVKHRDPLKGLGAGVALTLVSTLFFGTGDSGMALVGNSGLLTSLHFSRSMESAADKVAVETLQNHYGNVNGATTFFETIMDESSLDMKFLQTHPLTEDRIKDINQHIDQNNWLKMPDHEIALPSLK